MVNTLSALGFTCNKKYAILNEIAGLNIFFRNKETHTVSSCVFHSIELHETVKLRLYQEISKQEGKRVTQVRSYVAG